MKLFVRRLKNKQFRNMKNNTHDKYREYVQSAVVHQTYGT